MHTAAIHEQLDVFGYLASKFPGTLNLTDFNGLTAMDYVNLFPDKTFQQQLLKTEIVCRVCSVVELNLQS